MRRAFVLQLTREATEDHCDGRIEHVDTGRSTHFHSVADAICFVRQVLEDTESAENDRSAIAADGSVNSSDQERGV